MGEKGSVLKKISILISSISLAGYLAEDQPNCDNAARSI